MGLIFHFINGCIATLEIKRATKNILYVIYFTIKYINLEFKSLTVDLLRFNSFLSSVIPDEFNTMTINYNYLKNNDINLQNAYINIDNTKLQINIVYILFLSLSKIYSCCSSQILQNQQQNVNLNIYFLTISIRK